MAWPVPRNRFLGASRHDPPPKIILGVGGDALSARKNSSCSCKKQGCLSLKMLFLAAKSTGVAPKNMFSPTPKNPLCRSDFSLTLLLTKCRSRPPASHRHVDWSMTMRFRTTRAVWERQVRNDDRCCEDQVWYFGQLGSSSLLRWPHFLVAGPLSNGIASLPCKKSVKENHF